VITGHWMELDEAHRLPMDVRGGVPLASPYEGTGDTSPDQRKPSRRGTTNGNARGGADDRRRRREWLVLTYRADKDVVVLLRYEDGRRMFWTEVDPGTEGAEPACRCYRCGCLLTENTLTVDRIKPGCQGGTYRRDNIRPACGTCNSSTGGRVRSSR
jgi:hypothetical protein